MSAGFSHLSFLEALRPDPGWRTDCAVISTYSAQMPVLAALLLALAGEADEAGSGSRVGLVRAMMNLRGKVHVLMQSGRLTRGRHDTSITALFDRFLLPVEWDEEAHGDGRSWHAKFALVRQIPEDVGDDAERWIFVLGSRNLTVDTSWDIGLSLSGGNGVAAQRDHRAQPVAGVAALGRDLANMFPALREPWADHAKRLAGVHWLVPKDLRVAELRLMLPESPDRGMPAPPPVLGRIVAVSPFLDAGAVDDIQRWPVPPGELHLLSTRTEFARVLAGARGSLPLKLLALSEPEHEDVRESVDEDDALEPEQMGLHAKLILAEHAEGASLWLGSPNLTRRAWTRNAEVFARVDGIGRNGARLLCDGVQALMDRADPVELGELDAGAAESDIEARLGEARNQVAAWLTRARQMIDAAGRVHLNCPDLRPGDPEVRLSIGQVRGIPVEWQPRSRSLTLPASPMAVLSECLNCRLSLEGEQVDWVQLVKFDPSLDFQERDERVLGEYLGARQMLTWIHTVLNGWNDGDEGGPWDGGADACGGRQGAPGYDASLPSLEQVLRMWLRERHRLGQVDRILALRRVSESQESDDDQRELARFTSTWKVLRAGLKDVDA